VACPTCSSDNPEVASYCHRCGTSLRLGDAKRSTSYAVQSAEGVTQFAVISTVMPHTSRHSADNYRWAMIISGVLILAATALGLLPIAIASAAFLVPLAYLVYIDDVNLWEEAPAAVVVGLFVATGALSVLVSLFFFDWVFDAQWASFAGGGPARGGIGSMSFPALLIFAVLLPVVAEVAKNLFAVLLAARPQFDDMIDGLTFGVAAGAAFAAAETIVVNRSLFSSFGSIDSPDAGFWVSLILSAAIVKPIVYGAATGIALAGWSGLGSGFDGFKPGYLRGLGEALLANILFQAGLFMASRVEGTAGPGLTAVDPGAVGVDQHGQQPGPALLHHGARRDEPAAGQRPRRPDARVAGEGQLDGRGEDAQPVVRVRGGRRQHEGRLGQVELAGDRLHRRRVESFGIEHHGERVAGKRSGREHVEGDEAAGHGASWRPPLPAGEADTAIAVPVRDYSLTGPAVTPHRTTSISPSGDLCERSLTPLRGGVLRWVPGRIPLSLHAPGKAADGAAPKPSTALSRKPVTQRGGVEGYPGPSARLAAKRRRISPCAMVSQAGEASHGAGRYGARPLVSASSRSSRRSWPQNTSPSST